MFKPVSTEFCSVLLWLCSIKRYLRCICLHNNSFLSLSSNPTMQQKPLLLWAVRVNSENCPLPGVPSWSHSVSALSTPSSFRASLTAWRALLNTGLRVQDTLTWPPGTWQQDPGLSLHLYGECCSRHVHLSSDSCRPRKVLKDITELFYWDHKRAFMAYRPLLQTRGGAFGRQV